ncbi:hypothetical protein SAMN02745702_02089 [Desulfobaculum bizertense DSM 18034]|uniref:tRNA(Ile2) 2-agmatinylcytidine synthetase n=2 Tax=Desulfobaculum TaxID=1433996 RepID=A0A1T4WCM4_9BACT|nr:hypothetical protein SAMN02745702_02089 [Desulfobaculum bizertense DSM 18034]
MKIFVGFDDTDVLGSPIGTGKLARYFAKKVPADCSLWGVVRYQLLVADEVPYTSHNSSACVIIEAPEASYTEKFVELGVQHLAEYYCEGSDPGLCVAAEGAVSQEQIVFGQECTARLKTQDEAMRIAKGVHLSGHGGTNDGIIGAAAAIGLTAGGWCGRFIELGSRKLRDFPSRVQVKELQDAGIIPLSIDRNATVPMPEDFVETKDWLRPRLWSGRPMLPMELRGEGLWESLGGKSKKAKNIDYDEE